MSAILLALIFNFFVCDRARQINNFDIAAAT